MITIPEELYTSELVDIMNITNEENENITLSITSSRYNPKIIDVVLIQFWFEKNTYYLKQFDYYNDVGNEIVSKEVKEILINIKNYLDILGFKDITQDE
jgi:hypothetical protein